MKLTTRGRYAVTAMLDLAINGGSRPVSLADISGRQEISLSYLEQLFAKLRHGLSIELAAELQEGAVEFDVEAKNRTALRSGDVHERRGPMRTINSVEELRVAMLKGQGRISDLLRSLDRDGDVRARAADESAPPCHPAAHV